MIKWGKNLLFSVYIDANLVFIEMLYRDAKGMPWAKCQIFLSTFYILILTPRRVASFFGKVISFYIHYTLSVPPYQPLSTGSGSIIGAGASRASPRISIGRTAIVMVRTPYIRTYVSVLRYR